MAEFGILPEDDPVEVIAESLIDMQAVGVPHIGTLMALNHRLIVATLGRAMISVQNPSALLRRITYFRRPAKCSWLVP